MKPLHDRVLVKLDDMPTQSVGGIALSSSAKNPDHYQRGEVMALGPGKLLKSGKRRPIDLKLGNTVLWPRQFGVEVLVNDQKCMIVTEEQIMAAIVGGTYDHT